MINPYQFKDRYIIATFIVGSKYCTVGAYGAEFSEVIEAVKAWHEEVDPQGSMLPFVLLSSVQAMPEDIDCYLQHELFQVKVNI